MNMGQMMQMVQKAQTIQKKLQETQAELAQAEYEVSTGGVTAICDGQGKFKSIEISKEAINPENPESVDDDTIEMLEDIISTAIKQASDKAVAEMETKMKAATGGISIPGLF